MKPYLYIYAYMYWCLYLYLHNFVLRAILGRKAEYTEVFFGAAQIQLVQFFPVLCLSAFSVHFYIDECSFNS